MDRNEYLPGILNGVTGAGILIISILVEFRFPISKEISKLTGYSLVAAGMLLFVWAATHIKGAILGEVKPKIDVLVQIGPYRYIRHPVYLGITIALIGVTVSGRSWPGLIGVFLLFLPTAIYRAKLEEQELSKKFGEEWENYKSNTGFILPITRKK